MTKAPTARDHKGRKARSTPVLRRTRRCPQCPFYGPGGQCLDDAIRSGRCGDWVWYLRGNKQCHRLWVNPSDRRTAKQLHWRKRLGAVSNSYSGSLTDEQQEACIAAGATLRSRPRLGQWGRLTGQQYWVRKECSAKPEPRAPNAQKLTKGLQTQGISLSTWDPHRRASIAAPGQRRRDMGGAGEGKGSRKNEVCGTQNARIVSGVRQHQTITRSTWARYCNATRSMRPQAACNSDAFRVMRGNRQGPVSRHLGAQRTARPALQPGAVSIRARSMHASPHIS